LGDAAGLGVLFTAMAAATLAILPLSWTLRRAIT
jgi:hypothetical protein